MIHLVPQFQMPGFDVTGNSNGLFQEEELYFMRVCQNATGIKKRHRRHETTEKPAFLDNQGKNAVDPPIFFGRQIVSLPSKTVFDYLLPAPEVAIGPRRMRINIVIPALRFV